MIVRLILAVWLLAEALTYVAFFSVFPVSVGLLVGLGSIIAGLAALRFGGRSFLQDALAALSSPRDLPTWRRTPLGLLGATLLLIPGFLTDALGLVLIVTAALTPWKRPAQTSAPREVELSRDEWTRLPDDPPK